MNKREKYTKLCNMIAALLMAALIIMQFVPFWYSVGGEHMTDEQYLAWSEDYVPVAERPTESKAPTTAATTEAPTTETPTTEAPTESTPTESTPAESTPAESTPAESTPAESTPAESTPAESTPAESTPAESTPAESTPEESVPEETTKKSAGKDPFGAKNRDKNKGKEQAVKPPMPTEIPTDPEVQKISIAQSVWRTNRYNKDQAAPLLMFHVAVLGIGAVGIFFCLTKRKASLNCVWVLVVAIMATLGYFTNAAAQTGMNWMVHGILSAALLIPGVILLVFSILDAIRWFTKIED